MATPVIVNPAVGSAKTRTQGIASVFMTVAPFLICALPSILLLLFVPPLMNYGDSASLLCGSLADNAAQRPLLYPCFVQYFVKTFGFTNLAIYSILCLQHILVLAGASYMVLSVKEPGQRVLLALMAVFANFFFLLNNGIYSESLDSGFLFFYFGTALRLTLQSNIENRAGLLVLSFVSVAFMGLSNPYLLAFSVLIPAAYLFNALVSRDKQKLSAELKPFLQSLLVVFLAVFTILAANFLTENLLGQSLLPSFGRVSLPVMRSFPWSSIPKEQKSALLAKMQKRCSGDYSRLALSFIVAGNYGNVDVYQQLKALEAQFGHGKNAEQSISNAALAFFFTPNRYLANQAVNGFYKCMGEDSFVNWLSLRSGTSRCLNSIIDAAATSSRIYQSDRSIEQRLSQIPALKNSEPSKYFQVASLLNTACFDGVCHYIPLMLIAVILSLSGLALGASSKERLAFVLSLSGATLIYAVLCGTFSLISPASLLPVNAAIWLMLAISAAALPTLVRKGIMLWQNLNPALPSLRIFGVRSRAIPIFLVFALAFYGFVLSSCPNFPLLLGDSKTWLESSTTYRASGYGVCVALLISCFHHPYSILALQVVLSGCAISLLVLAVEDAFQSVFLALLIGYLLATKTGLLWLHVCVLSDSLFFSAMTAILALTLLQLRNYRTGRSVAVSALFSAVFVFFRTVGITFAPVLSVPFLALETGWRKRILILLASLFLSTAAFEALEHLPAAKRQGSISNLADEAALNAFGIVMWLLDDQVKCEYPDVVHLLSARMHNLQNSWNAGSASQKYELLTSKYNDLIWNQAYPVVSEYTGHNPRDPRIGKIISSIWLATYLQRPLKLMEVYSVNIFGCMQFAASGAWNIDLQNYYDYFFQQMQANNFGRNWIASYHLANPHSSLGGVLTTFDPLRIAAFLGHNQQALNIILTVLCLQALATALWYGLVKRTKIVWIMAAGLAAAAWFAYVLALLSCEIAIYRYTDVAVSYLLVGSLGFFWSAVRALCRRLVPLLGPDPLKKLLAQFSAKY